VVFLWWVFLLCLDFLKKNLGKWLTSLFCVMNFCLVPILHKSLHTTSILPWVHTGLSKTSIASARTIENDLKLEMVSVLTTYWTVTYWLFLWEKKSAPHWLCWPPIAVVVSAWDNISKYVYQEFVFAII
jgi:hypothetical protein